MFSRAGKSQLHLEEEAKVDLEVILYLLLYLLVDNNRQPEAMALFTPSSVCCCKNNTPILVAISFAHLSLETTTILEIVTCLSKRY